MNKPLPHHPLADLFPMISGDELAAFVENIRLNGLKRPILTTQYKGKWVVADGRTRQLACIKLGIKPKYETWDGQGDLLDTICALNLRHRSMTKTDLAVTAEASIQHIELTDEQTAKLQPPKGVRTADSDPIDLKPKAELAAAKFGVSPRYIYHVRHIRRKFPKIYKQMRDGDLNLSKAIRACHREAKAVKQSAAVLPPLDETQIKMIHGDCIAQLELLPSNSVDLIFADPPYNLGFDYGNGAKADLLPVGKFQAWCAGWLAECERVLKPKGSIFVMINTANTDFLGVELEALGLTQRNIIIWHETFGNYTDDNFTKCARFIHYYAKGKGLFTFNKDAVRIESDRQKMGDKRANPGGKVPGNVWTFPRLVDNAAERIPGFPTQIPVALVERIVLAASGPGDLVIDPFNGSGTTAVACIRHGRRFTGFDTNAKYIAAAKQRAASEMAARKAAGK